MAFSSGKVMTEATGGSFKRFVGVAAVKVLALNPDVKTYNALTGANREEELVYTGDKDGVKFVRLSFLCQISPNKDLAEPENVILTFWMRKQPIIGSNSGKIKIIDKYGRTAWATDDDIKNARVPQYSSGPANVDADYRKCVSGEEELTKFLKALMGIPEPTVFNKTKGVSEPYKNLSECEARLDKIMKYFDGDVSEIRNILKSLPENKVKVLLGVRQVDGREYQDFFTEQFVKSTNPSNLGFAKELNNALSIGKYANTYFGDKDVTGNIIFSDAHVYEVTPTTYTESTTSMPEFSGIPAQTPVNQAPFSSVAPTDDDMPF